MCHQLRVRVCGVLSTAAEIRACHVAQSAQMCDVPRANGSAQIAANFEQNAFVECHGRRNLLQNVVKFPRPFKRNSRDFERSDLRITFCRIISRQFVNFQNLKDSDEKVAETAFNIDHFLLANGSIALVQ